jgi:NADH-quinone oxidoreductase subunit N
MDSFPFTSAEIAAVSPEIAIVVGAMFILVWGAYDRPRARPARFAAATLATLAVAAGAAVFCVVPHLEAGAKIFGDQLSVDPYGVFFSILFVIAAALAVLASIRFLDDEQAHGPEYYVMMLCALLGMMVMARGVDFITLFVGLELQALSVYVLVGYLKGDRRSNEGAMKYFILGGLSSGVFVYALSLLYAVTGTTQLDGVAAVLGETSLLDHPLTMIGLILLVVALGFKIAAVPFHVWAPDAYTGAATPVALFISVASKAAAFALMVRVLNVAFGPMEASWTLLLAVLAAATMTFGNIAALTQENVKRLLAYSSISHAGYALLGVIAGTTFGIAATMFYLLAYAFMNVGAWGIVILLRRQGLAGDLVSDFNGLAQRSWWATGAMLIFLLSLGGIPPTIGFLGKWYVFGAAIESGWVWLAVLGVLNAAISLYYYLRIAVAMTIREPADDVVIVNSLPLNVTLAIATVVTLLGIIWASPIIEWARTSTLSL